MSDFDLKPSDTLFEFTTENIKITLFKGKKYNSIKPKPHGFSLQGTGSAGCGLQIDNGAAYINISKDGDINLIDIPGFSKIKVDFEKKEERIYFFELDVTLFKTVS